MCVHPPGRLLRRFASSQRQLNFRVIASVSVAIPLKKYAAYTPTVIPTDCRGRCTQYDGLFIPYRHFVPLPLGGDAPFSSGYACHLPRFIGGVPRRRKRG